MLLSLLSVLNLGEADKQLVDLLALNIQSLDLLGNISLVVLHLLLDFLHLKVDLLLVLVNPVQVVVHAPHKGLAFILDSTNVLLDLVDDQVLHLGAGHSIGILDVLETARPVHLIDIQVGRLHNEDARVCLETSGREMLSQDGSSL